VAVSLRDQLQVELDRQMCIDDSATKQSFRANHEESGQNGTVESVRQPGELDGRTALSLREYGVVTLDNAAGTLTTRVEWFLAVAHIYRLGTLDIQIHDHWILPASDYHGLTRDIRAGIEFLMRDGRRHVNEVPRIGLIAEL
jgi:hypothetical protein